jgi:hypothetical protein
MNNTIPLWLFAWSLVCLSLGWAARSIALYYKETYEDAQREDTRQRHPSGRNLS